MKIFREKLHRYLPKCVRHFFLSFLTSFFTFLKTIEKTKMVISLLSTHFQNICFRKLGIRVEISEHSCRRTCCSREKNLKKSVHNKSEIVTQITISMVQIQTFQVRSSRNAHLLSNSCEKVSKRNKSEIKTQFYQIMFGDNRSSVGSYLDK